MRHWIFCVAVTVLCWPISSTLADDVWVESTFEDFHDGTLGDSGANMYVSSKGRIQTVNRWDVNRDGFIDLFFVNSHPLIEMLDMSIYWGNGKDYSIRNHTYVPVNGPMWVTPADLNADGDQDLVVANYSNGSWTSMDSAVYWGATGDDGSYSFKERTYLPSQDCQKAAVADFNGDGHADIVFAFSGGFWEYRNPEARGAPSRIYWNSASGFDPEKFRDLETLGASDVAVADLNADGHPDIVFANGDKDADSYIYYGNEDQFANQPTTKLPATNPHAVEIADVDNDGAPD